MKFLEIVQNSSIHFSDVSWSFPAVLVLSENIPNKYLMCYLPLSVFTRFVAQTITKLWTLKHDQKQCIAKRTLNWPFSSLSHLLMILMFLKLPQSNIWCVIFSFCIHEIHSSNHRQPLCSQTWPETVSNETHPEWTIFVIFSTHVEIDVLSESESNFSNLRR